jgi:hypothetical protein
VTEFKAARPKELQLDLHTQVEYDVISLSNGALSSKSAESYGIRQDPPGKCAQLIAIICAPGETPKCKFPINRTRYRMEPKKKKKSKTHKQKSNQGHYCCVCGERKASEKFSGKGHQAHICKVCQSKTPAEQSEGMTINRLYGMSFRHLSADEMKWLANRRNDSRPKVREAVEDVLASHFPRQARNEVKKKLHITELTFFAHCEVYDDIGDDILINAEFYADTTGKIVKKTFGDNGCVIKEESVSISASAIRKLFNVCVNNLDISFWGEDFGVNSEVDSPDDDEDFDVDDLECDDDSPEIESEIAQDEEPEEEPDESDLAWSVKIKYGNGKEQRSKGYYDLPMQAEDLYMDLDSYFEEDKLDEDDMDDEFDSDDDTDSD